MWPFKKKSDPQGDANSHKKKVMCYITPSLSSAKSYVLTVNESDYGSGVVEVYFGTSYIWAFLLPNGKTNIVDVTWIPLSGWTKKELTGLGFKENVKKYAKDHELLALAVLDGDKAAVRPLVDEVLKMIDRGEL